MYSSLAIVLHYKYRSNFIALVFQHAQTFCATFIIQFNPSVCVLKHFVRHLSFSSILLYAWFARQNAILSKQQTWKRLWQRCQTISFSSSSTSRIHKQARAILLFCEVPFLVLNLTLKTTTATTLIAFTSTTK